jgi:hypothetical protein
MKRDSNMATTRRDTAEATFISAVRVPDSKRKFAREAREPTTFGNVKACTGGQGSKVPAQETSAVSSAVRSGRAKKSLSGAQWNARCIQFNLSTLRYRTFKEDLYS